MKLSLVLPRSDLGTAKEAKELVTALKPEKTILIPCLFCFVYFFNDSSKISEQTNAKVFYVIALWCHAYQIQA